MKQKVVGYAQYHKGKLYFDEVGWSLIKKFASKQHRSPKDIVISALRRYANGKNKKFK